MQTATFSQTTGFEQRPKTKDNVLRDERMFICNLYCLLAPKMEELLPLAELRSGVTFIRLPAAGSKQTESARFTRGDREGIDESSFEGRLHW